jgi:hypothetical protein
MRGRIDQARYQRAWEAGARFLAEIGALPEAGRLS